MLKTQLQESKLRYYHHQEVFRHMVWELNNSQWRRFLADELPDNAFQAYRLTKEISTLKSPNGHLVMEVTEKANMIFEGTSLIPTVADLDDKPPTPLH
ncbi:hypothetical protein O181_018868 [Austropuccinia psidii MF-1]|uniref:Uncharacterized protein n=1 Tax=Austropuccinia psidii MF-1 TaxID=1389203 RepID=A0A9Q3GT29_9BASI|nr:hypothetical protein [Austropuccinia psidii MF-1]